MTDRLDLEVLLDKLIEILLVFDEKGQIVFANSTASDKLEYTNEELMDCNIKEIFRQEFSDMKKMGTFDVKRLVSGKELSIYRKNKSCFSVKISVFPAKTKGNLVLLAEDISVQNELKAQLHSAKEEEKENIKRQNEFTANVTHELRTPVNGIRGHVMSMLDHAQDEEQKKTLDIILYCCNNMSEIINNILDFSKMEAGKFTIEEKEFDFYKMMDRVIATHSTEINKKGLRLKVDVNDRIPCMLIGDELRLVQILNNLLSNAVKFTMVGYVSIFADVTMHVNDEVELFFIIKDTGIGISPQEQEKLFQSFSQVDASITRRFGGTGLGLAVTKQLVELMNGNIFVESEKGKGSSFSFSIHIKTGQQEEDDKRSEVYAAWAEYTDNDNTEETEDFLQFGEEANRRELKKRMDKLLLSIELGAWDKAETLASVVKALVVQGDDDIKKQVLRMEMAIRKSNYEKSMEMYQKVREILSGQLDI